MSDIDPADTAFVRPLPTEPVRDCFPPTERFTMPEWDSVVDAIEYYHRALYVYLTQNAELKRFAKDIREYNKRIMHHE